MIYLDNAATTFPKPEEVYSAVNETQRKYAVNAGRGSYRLSQRASDIIRETRSLLADLVHCQDISRIVFSSSATLAMNQIINGLTYSNNSVVYVSPFEHNAVIRPLHRLSLIYGFKIRQLPVLSSTQEIDIDEMKNQFTIVHPDYVFVNHVSNVTGYILPYEAIFDEAKRYGAVTVLDTSQSLGAIDVNVTDSKIDFLVFAGHKNLYANFGIGGFIYNSKIELKAFITGGTGSDSLNQNMPDSLPEKYEASSHDIISISSLAASLKWLLSLGIDKIYSHKKSLTEYAVNKLKKINSIELFVPKDSDSHLSIISFVHEEYTPNELAEILDLDFDISVRSGYHCAPYIHKIIGSEDTLGTVRISMSYFSTEKDIDALVDALKELEQEAV